MSNKPKFDPSQPFEVAAKPKFDASKPFSAVEVKKPSQVESALRGAAQGASFGFSDELTGGLEALKDVALRDDVSLSDLTQQYAQRRDESRVNNKAAELANPNVYLAGEVGGGVVSAFIPGLGAIGATGKAATLGKAVLAGAKGGAIQGALGGFGLAEGDLKNQALATLTGAATGGAIGSAAPALLKGVGKVTSGVSKLAGKAVRGATDTSEEMIDKALAAGGSKAVESASTRKEIQQRVVQGIQGTKDNLVAGSATARGVLEQSGLRVDKEFVTGSIDKEIAAIRGEGAFTDESKRTMSRLLNIKESIVADPGTALSGARLKNLIQDIDDIAFKGNQPSAAEFSKKDSRVFKSLRHNLDTGLKEASPEYAERMKPVAENAQLLKQLKGAARNPQAAVKNQFGVNASESNAEAFSKLGLDDDFNLAKLNKYFNDGTTNGSRKTVLGSVVGGAIGSAGWLLGPLGGAIGSTTGAAAGAAAGAALDKNGRRLALKAFELGQRLEPAAEGLGKFAKTLAEAAQKGPGPFLLTHELLSQQFPEYKKLTSP